MNDLTAAFGRAQLTRLEMYLEWKERSVPLQTRRLSEVPYLILPREPEGCEHTWYNYVIRFDVDAMGHADDARAFRAKIVRAPMIGRISEVPPSQQNRPLSDAGAATTAGSETRRGLARWRQWTARRGVVREDYGAHLH